MRFCDGDCNNCPIIGHPNSKQLTYLMNKLEQKFGSEVESIINGVCPNMTVCYNCRIDDFCHDEGCELVK